jgi:hypothetical protein
LFEKGSAPLEKGLRGLILKRASRPHFKKGFALVTEFPDGIHASSKSRPVNPAQRAKPNRYFIGLMSIAPIITEDRDFFPAIFPKNSLNIS